MTRKTTFFALLFLGTLLTSCHKFDGLSVPSYIHIDAITLNCDYYTYGAIVHNTTPAVTIDDGINVLKLAYRILDAVAESAAKVQK